MTEYTSKGSKGKKGFVLNLNSLSFSKQRYNNEAEYFSRHSHLEYNWTTKEVTNSQPVSNWNSHDREQWNTKKQ